ncbi:MAG: GNAT family N-acetyltransferase [Propionibacteriaceae bacterium]
MTSPDISLRRIERTDFDFLWHWMHAVPHAEWKQWDGPYFNDEETLSREDFDAIHVSQISNLNRRLILCGGDPIGIVTRYEEDPSDGGWWEAGIIIFDPAHWGQGLGGTALTLWTDIIFAETSAHVITLTTWSGNEPMVKSARRVGYVECGRIPEARSWNGQRWDSIKMSRLRSNVIFTQTES